RFLPGWSGVRILSGAPSALAAIGAVAAIGTVGAIAAIGAVGAIGAVDAVGARTSPGARLPGAHRSLPERTYAAIQSPVALVHSRGRPSGPQAAHGRPRECIP